MQELLNDGIVKEELDFLLSELYNNIMSIPRKHKKTKDDIFRLVIKSYSLAAMVDEYLYPTKYLSDAWHNRLINLLQGNYLCYLNKSMTLEEIKPFWKNRKEYLMNDILELTKEIEFRNKNSRKERRLI